jgi:hypothetical protein
MDGWLRFTRRVMCDLRTEPGDMAVGGAKTLIASWNHLLDEWHADLSDLPPGQDFVWEGMLEPDQAEYLLHALQRSLRSTKVSSRVNRGDMQLHGWMTLHIMERFIDSLETEGRAHAEYVEQLRSSMSRFAERLAPETDSTQT